MAEVFGRRSFLSMAGAGAAWTAAGRWLLAAEGATGRPNVILAMTDDQGWGDTGYNGHPALKTPTLDEMARTGIRFDRWYAGAPVCSPTRGSCLTGRHPYRYGIFNANVGHMRPQEVTLAEALKTQGYATGHFGKWHLGTLTTEVRESNRGGPGGKTHFAPPWLHGFDVCFSTEAKVPTYNPMLAPGSDKPYGTHYWRQDGTRETEDLAGDDSRVIMDRAIPFIRKAAEEKRPFLAVIWFHTPHLPVLAGPEHRKLYEGIKGTDPHYHGAITAMDEQMGRLRRALRELGIAENTMLWFCSDNGPEGQAGKAPGSAGPLRGRKRDLFEGGIRVPGLLEWPAKIKEPRVIAMPCCTSDYFPTVLDVLGFRPKGQPEPMDGVSLLPLIEGRMAERPRPIAFESGGQLALIANRLKLIRTSPKGNWMLFDIVADPGETKDLSAEEPDAVKAMQDTLLAWQASCKESLAGKDYR